MQPIVVMGVSGSGKSTVGSVLAQRLRVPFVDADTLHPPANVAKMAGGEPLDDDDRYPWLEQVGGWLADHHGGGVVACSALKRRYRDQLRAHCSLVEFLHLCGSLELIGGRWPPAQAISCRPRYCSRNSTLWNRLVPTSAASPSTSARFTILGMS